MTPKTFYFGMNEDSIESRNHQDQDPGEKLESEAKLPNRDRGDGRASCIADATDDTDDNVSLFSFFFSSNNNKNEKRFFASRTN